VACARPNGAARLQVSQIHHLANRDLGHLLTRSALTHPEVLLTVCPGPFCFFWCMCFLYYLFYCNGLRGILFIHCKQIFLLARILSTTGIIFNSFEISVFVCNLSKYYLEVCLTYFISAADIIILLASLATMILFLLPYNKFHSGSLLSPFLNTVIKTAFFYSFRIQILFICYLNL
jgi:hypothetical protein